MYRAHLALVDANLGPDIFHYPFSSSSSDSTASSTKPTPVDINAALDTLTSLCSLALSSPFSTSSASKPKHIGVALLATVLKARVPVAVERWSEVGEAVRACEEAMGLSYDSSEDEGPSSYETSTKASAGARDGPGDKDKTGKNKDGAKKESSGKDDEEYIHFGDPFERAMALVVLVMGVGEWLFCFSLSLLVSRFLLFGVWLPSLSLFLESIPSFPSSLTFRILTGPNPARPATPIQASASSP